MNYSLKVNLEVSILLPNPLELELSKTTTLTLVATGIVVNFCIIQGKLDQKWPIKCFLDTFKGSLLLSIWLVSLLRTESKFLTFIHFIHSSEQFLHIFDYFLIKETCFLSVGHCHPISNVQMVTVNSSKL